MELVPNGTGMRITSQGLETRQTSRTWRMNIDNESINGFITDDIDAVKQAVYKILNTERYKHIIYSSNYGIELTELFGKPMPFVLPEIPRRIKEALIQDDRVKDVDDFRLEPDKTGNIQVDFTVRSIFGAFNVKKEVKINHV